jgi:ribosomal protein S18 acetylase RimI-like enzyme
MRNLRSTTNRIPGVVIRPMTIDDYDRVTHLWSGSQAVKVYSASDSRARIALFLQMNPDTSFVADADGDIMGTILGGFDGRRGYIHHLAVEADPRGRNIGFGLLEKTLTAMKKKGIEKVHVFVPTEHNPHGLAFWESQNWQRRPDLQLMTYNLGSHLTVPSIKPKGGGE